MTAGKSVGAVCTCFYGSECIPPGGEHASYKEWKD